MGAVENFDRKLGVIISSVDVRFLDLVWPQVLPFIEAACRHGDQATVDQMRLMTLTGQYELFIAHLPEQKAIGAALIEAIQYPQYRAAHFAALGGRGVVDGGTAWGQLSAQLRLRGCSRWQAVARWSAAKLYTKHLKLEPLPKVPAAQSKHLKLFLRGEL